MRQPNGFIMLSSVLVLSAIFLVLAIGLTQRSLLTAEGSLLLRHGDAARSAARACAEYALMEMTSTLSYSGDDIVDIGDVSCTIHPIETTPEGTELLRTESVVSEHHSRVIVEVLSRTPDLSIGTYRAVTGF